eukprot:gnl/MRDRNA2_/MRDRNA2_86665_c0_seq2.p1 gnl/MRDRNA2_/MRDRNA2_86665_c0~~gnl/MRDRNA2_/MRDRNA2_86665_c0_seq2.p1  ORF type:complete len:583 (+),score=89.08 gnl/MRDRNA2_/MRDRNA2_86665_c0_seq2:65-1750(+)
MSADIIRESDTIALHWWKLDFQDVALESLYLQEQKKTLLQVIRFGFFIGLLTNIPDWDIWNGTLGSCSQKLTRLVGVFSACLLGLGFVLLCRFGKKCSYVTLERLLIISSVVLIAVISICDPYRSASICGEDPYAAWGGENLDFCQEWDRNVIRKRHSDGMLLLTYVSIFTGLHLLAPIRSCTSVLVPTTAVAMYFISSFAVGSPENGFRVKKATAFLALLGLLVWIGRRKMEKDARLAFAEKQRLHADAELQRRQVVQERVKRFNAEFLHEQATRMAPCITSSGAQSLKGHTKTPQVLRASLQSRDADSPEWYPESCQMCSLASDSSLVCLDPEGGSLKIIQAAAVGVGTQVLTISTATQSPVLASVTSIQQSKNDCDPRRRWRSVGVSVGDGGPDETVTLSDFLLAHTEDGFGWRLAEALLPDDMICGVQFAHHCTCDLVLENKAIGRSTQGGKTFSRNKCNFCQGSVSSSSSTFRGSVEPTTFTNTELSMENGPPLVVGLKIGKMPQGHALLVGSTFSSTKPRLFVAASFFKHIQENSCSDSKVTDDAVSLSIGNASL